MVDRSDNPNETSGMAASEPANLSYPKNSSSRFKTKLVFRKYSRFPSEDPTTDITAIITLPLPINVNDNYGLKTNSGDLGWLGVVNADNLSSVSGIAGVLKSKSRQIDFSDINAVEELKAGIPASTELAKKGVFQKIGLNVLASALGKNDGGGTVGVFTGVIQNPHTTMMFDGVNIRQFSLDWQFSPESEDESKILNKIFREIKFRSHPDELATSYALSYPDIVEVEFTGDISEYFPKYQKSFITNISINPTSNGGIGLYNSGAPTSYNFQLTLSELTIVTRKTLKNQYGENSGNI